MAMYILRRAAFRALASSPQLARSQSTLSSSSLKQITSFPKTSACSIPFRRSYATEQRDLEEDAKEKVDSATESIKDTAEHANERAQSTIESVAQRATEAAESVKSSVSAGIDAITPEGFGSRGGDRMSRVGRDDSRGSLGPNAAPSTTLYIGNLYFEVTEAGLRKEFGKYGNVSSVKIVYDGRGLSKGFGYVEFVHQTAAAEARNNLDGQVFEGRRLAVQYAIKTSERTNRRSTVGEPGSDGFSNPPSKTLFIGNMSYEMSDKDLNDLFRGIKNVLDVRVAIDRRTGQPRGFAHADFVDAKSAEAAVAYLQSKEFYGRKLRIDYSANAARESRGERESKSVNTDN